MKLAFKTPHRKGWSTDQSRGPDGQVDCENSNGGEQGVSEAQRGEACPEIERIIFCLRRLWWAEKTNWLIWPLPAQREIFKINILKTIRLTDKMKTMFKYVFFSSTYPSVGSVSVLQGSKRDGKQYQNVYQPTMFPSGDEVFTQWRLNSKFESQATLDLDSAVTVSWTGNICSY